MYIYVVSACRVNICIFLQKNPAYEDSLRSLRMLSASTRAYIHLVLLLRAQAEVELLLFEQELHARYLAFCAQDPG